MLVDKQISSFHNQYPNSITDDVENSQYIFCSSLDTLLKCSGFRYVFRNVFRFPEPICSEILMVSGTCFGIVPYSGTFSVFFLVSGMFSGFLNVFRNFSGFRNVYRNFSGFRNAFWNNFQFLKWNNSGICSGNGNRNSGIRIHISGSFRFLYRNFDPKYWNPQFAHYKESVFPKKIRIRQEMILLERTYSLQRNVSFTH